MKAPTLSLLTVLLIASLATPCFSQEQARPADSFVNFVGINAHVDQSTPPYANYPAVKSALLGLGVRHIRVGGWPIPMPSRYTNELLDLGANGIYSDFVVDGNWYPDSAGGYPNGYGKTQLRSTDLVPFFSRLSSAVETVEGPNEPNWNSPFIYLGQKFPEGVIHFDQDLYRIMKSSPETRHIPIVLNSVANMGGPESDPYSSMTAITPGPVSYADYGNLHCYPGADIPDNNGPWHSVSMDWQLSKARGTAGSPGIAYGKPIVTTETGYEYFADQWAVSERAGGIYIPRTLLEYYGRNVKRCYIYELFDEPAQIGKEAHWGVIRADGTLKPAYTNLKNLLDLLTDRGPDFQARSLDFHLSGPATLHHVLLQKRTGAFYLVLWNDTSCYASSRSGGSDVFNAPVPITLDLPYAARIAVFAPCDASAQNPTAVYTLKKAQRNLTLSVPDGVLVLRIVHH